jgi:YidC/Oxa1 family membrane protein insertase
MEILGLIWNTLILDPLLNGLVLLYAVLGRNFGVTIVVFTIVVRLATLPLTLRQIRSTQKMSALQPKLKLIQERYGKDRARLSQETMKLYKESGVSPIGCLGPLVIQFPIWIGLYMAIIQVLPTSPESLAGLSQHLYSWIPLVNQVVPLNSHFLGLNLASAETSPITYVMAIFVGASMWVMQKMSTPAAADPRQASTNRMMLWMMPVMFGFFTLSLPAGLPLYWFSSNIIGVVIQYFVTGWGGLMPSRKAPDTTDARPGVEAVDVDAQASLGEEATEDGERQYSDQRGDDRGGSRNRIKGTRRRSRGGRRRGR